MKEVMDKYSSKLFKVERDNSRYAFDSDAERFEMVKELSIHNAEYFLYNVGNICCIDIYHKEH